MPPRAATNRLSRRADVGDLRRAQRTHRRSSPAISPITASRRATRSRSCCRIRCPGSKAVSPSRAPAPSACRSAMTRPSRKSPIGWPMPAAKRCSPRPSAAICSRGCKAQAPNLKTLIVTDRGHCSADGAALQQACRRAAAIARRAIRLRCTTPRSFFTPRAPPAAPRACSSRCTACCGSTAACWAPITGLSRARHGAVAAAAVSFLRAQSVGAEHPRDRRQRIHHGAVLDQRSGAAPENRRVHLFPRRADHVSLSVAGDARRNRLAVSRSAALRFRRRHHAGDAQSRIRKPSRRASCSTATASPKPRPW